MGLRNIEDKILREAQMKEHGTKVALKELETILQDVHRLSKVLKQLEQKHGEELKKNPKAAQKWREVREELGLPEYVGVFKKKSRPGIFERLGGDQSFREQLAVQILDVGRKSKEETGGIMSIAEVVLRLNNQYEGFVVSISDCADAIRLLVKNNIVSGVRNLSSGLKIIEFFDSTLSEDHNSLLEVASNHRGELAVEEIVKELGWTIERTSRGLDQLVQRKIAHKKETLDGVIFFFPGL